MNTYEIKKELDELENYIKDMETESDLFKRRRMTIAIQKNLEISDKW